MGLIKFLKLDKEMQIAYCTIPQLVFITQNPDDETREQVIARQDRFIALPEAIKNKLSSYETGEKIEKIGLSFNLELLQMASIARSIRNFYFGEAKTEDFEQIYVKEIGITKEVAVKIAQAVIQRVIEDDSVEKEYEAQFEKMSLKDALKKYENLGEQLITSSHIKLRNFPEPVRPSLKNWLSDYNFNTGFGIHDAMVRGTYLFQNENAKKLDTLDRQKLAFALKNYDENSPVEINIALARIIFPKFEIIKSATSPLSPKIEKPKSFMLKKEKETLNLDFSKKTPTENKISFSSPHKFPFESQNKAKDNPAKSPVQSPKEPQPLRINPQGFRARPGNLKNEKLSSKNVVNLKE